MTTPSKTPEPRCKKDGILTPGTRMHYHQCHRLAVKDGFCNLHHPDSVKERRLEADKRYEAKEAASPWGKLKTCQSELTAVTAERDRWHKLALAEQAEANELSATIERQRTELTALAALTAAHKELREAAQVLLDHYDSTTWTPFFVGRDADALRQLLRGNE